MKTIEHVWAAIPLEESGAVAAGELADLGLGSEPYIRRVLRLWSAAGLIERVDRATPNDPHRYRRTAASPRSAPGLTAAGQAIDREPAMTAAEFAILRRRAGHSLTSLGRALGWTGKQPSIIRAMRRFESGERVIDATLAVRVRAVTAPPPVAVSEPKSAPPL